MGNIIKVKFNKDGKPQGRAYSYLTPVEVQVGDLVEISARSKAVKGTVTEINVPASEIESFKDKIKSVIGKAKEETEEDKNEN